VLARIRSQLTYANVMATIALFIALGGVAWAAATIDSGDVVDNSLKSVDLKDAKGVKGADVVPDSLDGTDIEEGSLSQVPSAVDAETLDGSTASDFLPAQKVRNSGRVALNDPTPGDTEAATSTLFVADGFTVRVRCWSNYNGDPTDSAHVQVKGPSGSSFAADNASLGALNNPEAFNLGDEDFSVVALANTAQNQVDSGRAIVVAPSGEVLNVSGSAEVNDTGGDDCVFGMTAVGP
jgi:hypothetical protein